VYVKITAKPEELHKQLLNRHRLDAAPLCAVRRERGEGAFTVRRCDSVTRRAKVVFSGV